MPEIKRELYVDRLLSRRWNGKVKIITGIRRCGKSYLLSHLFKDRLLAEGVPADHILEIALDRKEHADLRDPNRLYAWVLEHLTDEAPFYLFIDEIQLSYKVRREGVDESRIVPEDRELAYISFYDILNDLMTRPNLDIYVTGSNSRMLSKDIATNFRDRGTELRMFPLSFAEYYAMSGLEKADAWADYVIWGGMPLAVLEKDEAERARYLSGLFEKVYVADVAERYGVEDGYLESLIDVVASAVGSLTNPSKLANTLNSLIWGFNFIIGAALAMLLRVLLEKGRRSGVIRRQYQNNYLLNRISGFFFDMMIVAGIASINLEDIRGLWLPFILLVVAGAIVTWIHLTVVCKKVYGGYYYEGLISMYGMLTGTISSGVLLLREIDPNLSTPAANNLITGSSFGIVLGAPVLVLVSLAPRSNASCWLVMLLAAVYCVLLYLLIFKLHRRKKS